LNYSNWFTVENVTPGPVVVDCTLITAKPLSVDLLYIVKAGEVLTIELGLESDELWGKDCS
jgi:hypothetical protein